MLKEISSVFLVQAGEYLCCVIDQSINHGHSDMKILFATHNGLFVFAEVWQTALPIRIATKYGQYHYDTEIIKQTVKALGMNQRTADRYVGNFLKYRIAKRLGIGHYRKINVKK